MPTHMHIYIYINQLVDLFLGFTFSNVFDAKSTKSKDLTITRSNLFRASNSNHLHGIYIQAEG